jgi:hypothetical protein
LFIAPMITFEALALVYFVAIGAAAVFTRVPVSRRAAALAGAGAILLLIGAAAYLPLPARLGLGHLYLVAGYWLPALLVTRSAAPSGPTGFERWLHDMDRRLGRLPQPQSGSRGALELSYLLCYPLVPAAFVITWTFGPVEEASRFWTAVLASGFACYGTLPWLVARPPRDAVTAPLVTSARRTRLRSVNERVLRHVSHGMNTFPSGHVAVSVAATLVVMMVAPVAGAVLTAITVGVIAGAVAGRYHYTIDVLLGSMVGVLAAVAA